MADFFWLRGMWVFPLLMMIGMFVMAFLVCGRGARHICGHGGGHIRDSGVGRDDSLEILRRRYASGELTKDEFERIREDLRGESIAERNGRAWSRHLA